MTLHDHIDLINNIAKRDIEAALSTVWRLAQEHAGDGWWRSMRSIVVMYEYATALLRKTKLLTPHRRLCLKDVTRFKPVDPDNLLFEARRDDIERLLRLVKGAYGAEAAMWQKAKLHFAYPRICPVTQTEKDRLAHLAVMPLTHIAEMRA